MQVRAAMLWVVLAGAAGSALAVRVEAGPAPKAAAVREAASAAPAGRPDESSALREGVITALSDKADRVEIQGNWLDIAEGKTHIFRRGTVLAPNALQKGMKIRFTLAPGTEGRGTLGVVYVP